MSLEALDSDISHPKRRSRRLSGLPPASANAQTLNLRRRKRQTIKTPIKRAIITPSIKRRAARPKPKPLRAPIKVDSDEDQLEGIQVNTTTEPGRPTAGNDADACTEQIKPAEAAEAAEPDEALSSDNESHEDEVCNVMFLSGLYASK